MSRPISRVHVCIIVCACVCACIWLYMCIVYHLYTTIFIYLIIFTQMLHIFHLNCISSLQQGHTILVEIPQFKELDKYAHQFMEYLPNAVSLIIVMDIGNAGCTKNDMVICSFYFYFFLTRNLITLRKKERVVELRLIKQTDVFTYVNVQRVNKQQLCMWGSYVFCFYILHFIPISITNENL